MITEILSPNIEITWLPWAVAYFFFIGISFAAVTLTLPAILFGHKQSLGVARVAMLVMLICAIVGPVALLADIHQPARFWHFYACITPWSWMSIGAIFLPIYVVATFIYSWLFLRPALLESKAKAGIVGIMARILGVGSWQGQHLLKLMAMMTLILGMIIALYTGAEVAIVATRELWSSYLIPVFFFTTALLAASSLSLLLAYLMHEDNVTLTSLSRYSRWSALLSLAVLAYWFVLAIFTNGAEARSLVLLQHSTQWQLNLGLLVLLFAVTAFFASGSSKLILLAALGGLVVSWFSRWLIFIDGQTIPKYGAGFYTYELPWGTEGLSGILGIFGLWLFLAIVLYQILPWKNRTESRVEVQS